MELEAARIDAGNLDREGVPIDHPQLDRLIRTIWRLRQPDGCPWDMAQTHISIERNMIEEAYEAAEAIEQDAADKPAGREHLVEELGDMLEQVLLHAQIAADAGRFSIDDIAQYLNEKLVRRHPHVFGDVEVTDAESALASWNDVKKVERAAEGQDTGSEPGLLDSIPFSMPALMQCQKISNRTVKLGFEWDSLDAIWDQVASEIEEFRAEEPGSPEAEAEFGDVLFALVNVARYQDIDAESALRSSCTKFRERWAFMEGAAHARGIDIDSLSTADLNELWDEAKAALR
ncbi:MAG: nucleoside triphosphate pyrophosphohydrolase [Atopobiaceae bacterium]|nr:nucleoside triphosphate pyrophosphohydrolase [Atopobiaceae bacterium]